MRTTESGYRSSIKTPGELLVNTRQRLSEQSAIRLHTVKIATHNGIRPRSSGFSERNNPTMRLNRTTAVVGTALLIGGLATTTAQAAGTLSKTVINPAGETITVNFSGLSAADGVVFVQQCQKNGNAPGVVFNQLTDCSQATGLNPFIPAGGAGSTPFALFAGIEPNLEEWSCGNTVTSGIPNNNTCYVRLAPAVKSNVSTDEFYAFTYGAEPVVPEVPLNVLLPAGAAAMLGAGMLINRKRQLRAA